LPPVSNRDSGEKAVKTVRFFAVTPKAEVTFACCPRTHPLPRVRMAMLQSVSQTQPLHYLQASAASFNTHKRRYGAGVSTSGSQPENPGSIPGTATKLSRLISFAFTV
jgi:hypothetical protein